MKTVEIVRISPSKVARIQELNDGGYRVSLEQAHQDVREVIAANYVKTLAAATKRVEGWK